MYAVVFCYEHILWVSFVHDSDSSPIEMAPDSPISARNFHSFFLRHCKPSNHIFSHPTQRVFWTHFVEITKKVSNNKMYIRQLMHMIANANGKKNLKWVKWAQIHSNLARGQWCSETAQYTTLSHHHHLYSLLWCLHFNSHSPILFFVVLFGFIMG